jgi:hypothetical protein
MNQYNLQSHKGQKKITTFKTPKKLLTSLQQSPETIPKPHNKNTKIEYPKKKKKNFFN